MLRTLTPALSTLIAILLFFFFTQPKFDEAKLIDVEATEYEQAVENFNTFVSTLKQKLAIKQQQTQAQNDKLDLLIPDAVDDTRLLVDIEALVKRHGMLLGGMSASNDNALLVKEGVENSATSVSDEMNAVDVTFDVIGTYPQFKDLLREIEQSSELLEVTSMSFSASEGSFQQFSLNVRTYSLPNR